MAKGLARFLVFFTSASVLVIEILAVRLVAPYLGVSLETFTGVIGVILAGIATGAWLGGRASDRVNPSRMLGPLLVVGGTAALVSPLIVDAIGPELDTRAPSILALTLVSFFIPAAILSGVPPVIVKIQLASLDETGSVVGSYSAIGTFGALVGTFVTGFVLIAAFPTRPMVAVLGISLIVIGILLSLTRGIWAVMLLAATAAAGAAMVQSAGPCDFETTYHCAVIETDDDNPTGRILVLDRLRNSYVDVADPTHLEFRYIKTMADIIDASSPTGAITVVSIGGGGFTLPGYVQATRAKSTNTVLEIDGSLVEIARDELALSASINVEIADARGGLASLGDDNADFVIGDAFSGLSVPWHLTTVEFAREISRVLTPDGVYMMNVIDHGDLSFLRSEAATLSEVFSNVVLFAPHAAFNDGRGGNFVLAASDARLAVGRTQDLMRRRNGLERALFGSDLEGFIDGARQLTDDFAPVDQMLSRR